MDLAGSCPSGDRSLQEKRRKMVLTKTEKERNRPTMKYRNERKAGPMLNQETGGD